MSNKLPQMECDAMSLANMRVLLLDDHALFRKGLLMVLKQDAGVRWEFKEASSVNEGLEVMRAGFVPHLVLLDIQLPAINGLDGFRLLRKACPSARIAMLSALTDRQTSSEALVRGADGFISKTTLAGELFSIVCLLLRGERYFEGVDGAMSSAYTTGKRASALTPRQMEVLSLVAQGDANKVIARKMALSENTVRVHMGALFDYFGCNSRSQVVFLARERGVLV